MACADMLYNNGGWLLPIGLSAALAAIVIALCAIYKRISPPKRKGQELFALGLEEKKKKKKMTVQWNAIPGDSPVHYVGDPRHDILTIASLDLVPNPPTYEFQVVIRGRITQPLGVEPQFYTAAYLNGYPGPDGEMTLCADSHLEIFQDQKKLPPAAIPTVGEVVLVYKNYILYPGLKKGLYTVRVELYTSQEVGRARVTAFEGTWWNEGGFGDGCGGW